MGVYLISCPRDMASLHAARVDHAWFDAKPSHVDSDDHLFLSLFHHLQPRDDEASEIPQEPSEVGDPDQLAILPWHDRVNTTNIHARSSGLLEDVRRR